MSENVYPKASEGGETAHVAPNPASPTWRRPFSTTGTRTTPSSSPLNATLPADHSQNEFVFFDGPAVRQWPAALRPPADRATPRT